MDCNRFPAQGGNFPARTPDVEPAAGCAGIRRRSLSTGGVWNVGDCEPALQRCSRACHPAIIGRSQDPHTGLSPGFPQAAAAHPGRVEGLD